MTKREGVVGLIAIVARMDLIGDGRRLDRAGRRHSERISLSLSHSKSEPIKENRGGAHVPPSKRVMNLIHRAMQVMQLRSRLPALGELIGELTSYVGKGGTRCFRLVPTLKIGEALGGLMVDVHFAEK